MVRSRGVRIFRVNIERCSSCVPEKEGSVYLWTGRFNIQHSVCQGLDIQYKRDHIDSASKQ